MADIGASPSVGTIARRCVRHDTVLCNAEGDFWGGRLARGWGTARWRRAPLGAVAVRALASRRGGHADRDLPGRFRLSLVRPRPEQPVRRPAMARDDQRYRLYRPAPALVGRRALLRSRIQSGLRLEPLAWRR